MRLFVPPSGRRRPLRQFLLLATASMAAGLLLVPGARAQDEPIKLKATLVQVPVVVSDSGGRYITDLRKDDFKLSEDGVLQDISLFAPVDEPFSVALLLDSSGSTQDQLQQIKSAALAFIDNLRPQDRVLVMNFDDSVHIECEFTSDRAALRRAVEAVQAGEFTQVYEAVYTAVWEKLRFVHGRRAAIIFTDGIDTASSAIDEDDTLNAVDETQGVLVYPIRYSTRGDVERRLARRRQQDSLAPSSPLQGHAVKAESPEQQDAELDKTYRAADEYLEELADDSGGIVERADTLKDLGGAFARIAAELRQQYLLGYYPSKNDSEGEERRIKVTVDREGVKVRARPSYRAPE